MDNWVTLTLSLCHLQYCHKKQKFQGFEYCGKNCAALANPPGSKGARNGAPAAGVSQQPHNGAGTYGKGGNNPNPQQQQRQQAPPVIDPVQIASQYFVANSDVFFFSLTRFSVQNLLCNIFLKSLKCLPPLPVPRHELLALTIPWVLLLNLCLRASITLSLAAFQLPNRISTVGVNALPTSTCLTKLSS